MSRFASEALEVIGELKHIVNLKDQEITLLNNKNRALELELQSLRSRVNSLSESLKNV